MKKITMLLLYLIFAGVGALWAQNVQISGVVTDATDGQPIPGVSVVVKGTNVAIGTDASGRYAVTARGDAVLVFSFLGMKTVEEAVAGRTTVNVSLESDVLQLDDVMIVAYGTARKSVFTGSAATVDNSRLQSAGASFDKAMQGQLAGVQVTSSSGQPGSVSSFRIRGSGSLNASNEPLYVVDGVPISANTEYSRLAEYYTGSSSSILSTLNPQDIESITVLKDAAAASLYGSRAANGVILINTKSGGKSDRTNISFSGQFGFSSVPKAYDLMNSSEFYRTKWQAYYESEIAKGLSPGDAAVSANTLTQGAITFNPYSVDNPIGADGQLVSGARIIVDTDWQDAIFNTAYSQDYNINIAGGSEKTNYFFSFGYFDQEGVTPSAFLNRYSGKVNVSTIATSWLKAGVNVTFSHSEQHQEVGGSRGASPLYNALGFNNGVPIYLTDKNGNYILDTEGNLQFNYTNPTSKDFNPLATPYTDKNSSKNYRFLASAFLDFQLYKGLNLKTVFSPDFIDYAESSYWSKEHGNGPAYGGRADRVSTRDLMYTSTSTLNYQNTFAEKHSINAMAGVEYWQSNYERVEAGATTFPIDGMDELSAGADAMQPSSSTTKEVLISYLGRVEYSYNDRYNFSFSLRSDGSSVFGKENKWGTFWSVGASWRMEEEDFIKTSNWIDQLKLRVSYGTSGNNQGLARYQSLGLWDITADYIYGTSSGSGHTQLANLILSWEKQDMFNIGIDYRFLKRFYGSIDYFYKNSHDLLYNYPLAASNGFESIMKNIAQVSNSGIEFLFGAAIFNDTPVRWDVELNFSAIRDKIEDLVGEDLIVSDTQKIWSKGYSQYEFYMPTWAGVNPDNGDPQWVSKDANGNVTLTNLYSRATPEKQGRATPDFYGGLRTGVSYKDFDLSILFSYSWGGLVYDGLYESVLHEGNLAGAQMHRDDLNAWTPTNRNTNIPKYMNNNTSATNSVSSRYLFDATNVKLKNITLSYHLPVRHFGALAKVVTGGRIFVSADNLFTWFKSDWKGYSDLDIFGPGGYTNNIVIPIPTVYTIGFNFNF
ncbi:MAG: TonB-dependent receptor [Prevotellaceae bacterium]|jgi:TonB-linked SusC/RagA family outer membrane protein|nr:TonB-dependent receptor [Prevotellaceae bacterium]